MSSEIKKNHETAALAREIVEKYKLTGLGVTAEVGQFILYARQCKRLNERKNGHYAIKKQNHLSVEYSKIALAADGHSYQGTTTDSIGDIYILFD